MHCRCCRLNMFGLTALTWLLIYELITATYCQKIIKRPSPECHSFLWSMLSRIFWPLTSLGLVVESRNRETLVDLMKLLETPWLLISGAYVDTNRSDKRRKEQTEKKDITENTEVLKYLYTTASCPAPPSSN